MNSNDDVNDIFNTDTSPTFQIAVLSNFIARPFYEQIGNATGININEWRILLILAAKPGIVQTDIASATGLHKMTVSRSLRSMVKYVAIKAHPHDKRKKVAHLTDAGWCIYRRQLPALYHRQHLLVQAMGVEECSNFKLTLGKLVETARTWSNIDLDLPKLEPIRK